MSFAWLSVVEMVNVKYLPRDYDSIKTRTIFLNRYHSDTISWVNQIIALPAVKYRPEWI